MSKQHNAILSVCFLILWKGTTLLVTSSQDTTSDSDAFTIRHSSTGKCLVANGITNLGLAPCSSTSQFQWKWGSGQRLFHVYTSLCLGLEVQTKMLSLLECDDKESSRMLAWLCTEGAVYTNYQMGLTVTNGKVSARRDSNDTWTRDGSQDSICQKPYRVIHTANGNSAGAPCDFPFLFNGTWHHGCLPEEDVPGLSWCPTTSDYDRDGKMGHCLIPEEGCQSLFGRVKGGSCYQFVSSAAVTWQEALISCRSQGADLLSLSSPAELISIMDGLNSMPEKMWIGLHQLDVSQGWQWSDGSALSYLRWELGMPPTNLSLAESDCGVLNAAQNYQSEACNQHLPYICKKSENASRTSTTESTVYKETECELGWVPWNGWCYKVVKDKPMSFTDAMEHCNKTEGGGSLATLHSLDTKELISTHFHEGGLLLDVWIGLISSSNVFTWTDRAPVTFTFWDPNQPSQPTDDPSCVFYTGQSHGWRVGTCSTLKAFMCQKKGDVKESAVSKCPTEGGWRRHSASCYQVNPIQVSFKDHCNITIRNKFEQAFISRLLVEQISTETKYFWIGLQDIKNTGEYQWLDGAPVTYDNWGWSEPERGGGCVVMSTKNPLGKWEVKNCTSFKAGTVCKTDNTFPPPEVDANASCADGWLSRPSIKYCYKVFHEERLSRKRSWEEAERFCQALGANLASFTHPEEMNDLHKVIEEAINDNRFFWVGLNRRDPADQTWKWSNGNPVTMATLHQRFHEDDAYNRNCAAFKTRKANIKDLFHFLFDDIQPPLFSVTPFHCDAKLEWVCQIPRGKKLNIPVWYNPGGHHETSIFTQGKELWFVKEPVLTFEEAKLFCNGNGSKMAEPKSFNAVTHIIEYIKQISSSTQSWWVEMKQQEHVFPMTNNQMHFYHSRFLGRCTSLSGEQLIPEYINTCEQRLPFVCERHNVTLIERQPLEPHAYGLPCENTTLAFRDKCYTLVTPSAETFKQANEECNSQRGTLVTISDQVEQDFVSTLLPRIPEVQKLWIGLKLKMNGSEWVDKSPVSFLFFNPLLHGMLRPIVINRLIPDSLELCVFMINHPSSDMLGTWDYSYCSDEQHLAICQHYADKPEEPRVPSEPIHISNHTFLFLHRNLTWPEALQQCREHKMELASVADISLQSVLTVHVSRAHTPMWIGLFSEDDGIHYHWTDGSHNVFSRWPPEATSGSCVYQDTDGFWKATECEEILEGAICHKPHKEKATTTTVVTAKCPHKINGPNWIPFKTNCYTFQLFPSRWEAFGKGSIHKTCKNLDPDAEILTVRNAEENEFIKHQLVPFKDLVQYVWLGLYKDDNDNQLKWYDGTIVQYSNWRAGRPGLQEEFMAGLNPDGQWELFTKIFFSNFKQHSIVACKLDHETKDDYNMSLKNFERYGSLTYQVVSRKLNWFQALEECEHRGGYLASIHDTQHDAHVEMISKTDGFAVWIGLSSHGGNGTAFEWADGTVYDYEAAISDPPGGVSSKGGQSSCVYVTPKGDWVRMNCHNLLDGAICYNTSINTNFQKVKLKAAPESSHCPPSKGGSMWVQNKDYCYAVHNHMVYNMEEAKSICQRLDAIVLTVNTKEENDFIVAYVSKNPFITNRVWLGMDLDTQGTPVAWLDGSSVDFHNWRSGDPEAWKMSEAPCAVLMSADGGTWKRISCEATLSRVICKTASSRSSPVALGLLVVVLVALFGAIGFIIYKKNRAYFPSTVRYKRTYDDADADATAIVTDVDA